MFLCQSPTASPLPPTPYPAQTKATKKGTCRWKEQGRDEECSWQCPSRHCLEKSSLPGGDGTRAGGVPSWLWLAGTVLQRWRSLRPWEPRALYSLKPALAPPTGRLQPGLQLGESLGAGRACAPGPQGQAPCTGIWDSTSSHPRQLHVLVCASESCVCVCVCECVCVSVHTHVRSCLNFHSKTSDLFPSSSFSGGNSF